MDSETITDLIGFVEYTVILSGLRYFVEADFLARFLRAKARPAVFIPYITACFTASFWLATFPAPLWIQFFVHFMIMFSMAMALLKKADLAALAPCVIAATLFALSDGMNASILRSNLLFPVSLLGTIWGTVWGLTFPFSLALALLAASYCFLKYISNARRDNNSGYAASYLHLLLLPCLMTILVMHFNWGLWDLSVAIIIDADTKPDYAQVSADFILLLCAFLGFIAVLAAFFKLMESAERDAETSNLERQIKIQRQYVAEAQQRGERYRSFHHDIGNHFSVLSGLLSAGKNSEASEYLRKIKHNADDAIEAVNTGNAALDVLLGEKTAYAKRQGIAVAYDMQFGKSFIWGVDDFDLCVIFANAMDNAIHACEDYSGGTKHIKITSKVKNNFLFIEIENTCAPLAQIVWGVGLKNMQRTAEKYQGTINASASENLFRLSALLCLPGNSEFKASRLP